MPDRTELVRGRVAAALAELEELFAPEMKLTFLARWPGKDECSMLISNDDDLSGVRRVIELLGGRGPT